MSNIGSIADVWLGLDKRMDISGNIPSGQLITSSTNWGGKTRVLGWAFGLRYSYLVSRAFQGLLIQKARCQTCTGLQPVWPFMCLKELTREEFCPTQDSGFTAHCYRKDCSQMTCLPKCSDILAHCDPSSLCSEGPLPALQPLLVLHTILQAVEHPVHTGAQRLDGTDGLSKGSRSAMLPLPRIYVFHITYEGKSRSG